MSPEAEWVLGMATPGAVVYAPPRIAEILAADAIEVVGEHPEAPSQIVIAHIDGRENRRVGAA